MQKRPSFIESFVEYCTDFPTPDLFKKWTAISMVAGAMERRVWAFTRNSQLVPNFIILLVAPPGIGKSRVIIEAHDILSAAGSFNVAPTTITRAAMIDQFNDHKKIKQLKNPDGTLTGKLFESHPLLIASPEFGVLVPKHDLEFLNTINDLYDCRSEFVERRRSLDSVITLPNPYINILAGTQPSYLGELLPETAYGMGFTSRCIMVYQGSGPDVPIFGGTLRDLTPQKDKLIADMKRIGELFGLVSWTKEAQVSIQAYVNSGMEPTPTHARLLNYCTRRDLHLLKLCVVSAIANSRMEIGQFDFEWAKFTLLEVETYMGDVFKDMLAGPDTQIISELHQHVRVLYMKDKRPVSQARLVHFLSTRIPSNRVLDIIGTMVKADLLEELPQSNGLRLYAPRVPEV